MPRFLKVYNTVMSAMTAINTVHQSIGKASNYNFVKGHIEMPQKSRN